MSLIYKIKSNSRQRTCILHKEHRPGYSAQTDAR